ncbi:MAG: putative metal-dependent hydrolase with the TIM-barrel fold, partial [Verrucomicrobia bacterium]|nr:putative metal-dependent hydrolase with the TIM-barrel fold [Verrucomicrobiota bacterium]
MSAEARWIRWRALRLIALAALAPAAAMAGSLLLVNGNIYTANDAAPRATAVVVVEGRITYVGDSAGASAHAPADAMKIDLARGTVVPGLTDAHAHLAGIGFRELNFNLEGTTGIADLQRRLRGRAASSTTKGWITGRGWIESHWAPPAFPTKADLDEVVADRPVLLTRADGHAAVANSFALKVAHIDATTPDPSGGQVL